MHYRPPDADQIACATKSFFDYVCNHLEHFQIAFFLKKMIGICHTPFLTWNRKKKRVGGEILKVTPSSS
jgi:hypothetical protein